LEKKGKNNHFNMFWKTQNIAPKNISIVVTRVRIKAAIIDDDDPI